MNDKHLLKLEGSVSVVLMEWLPMGRHSMGFLQEKLECTGGARNFFVTNGVDRDRNVATVRIPGWSDHAGI